MGNPSSSYLFCDICLSLPLGTSSAVGPDNNTTSLPNTWPGLLYGAVLVHPPRPRLLPRAPPHAFAACALKIGPMFLKMAAGTGDAEIVDTALAGTADAAPTVDVALTVDAALTGKDAALTGKDAALTGKVDAALAGTVATAGTNDAAVDTELAGIGTDCVDLKRRFTSLLTCG
ncbi:hypothetical protein OS493_000540 [Desmophyllum pertusum]|uniref:Uncharacterized protein n=1 Tax=Desmophyllum pertusum TaxID=174260 RepID=A0A9X0A8G2_9CNID|nr:hypothetical protein OS493_000540 [Desmophyllum pertusum]